jgi:protein-tyrosine phosphatase
MQLMAEKGIDISTHQAQMIDGNLIAQSALVLCMEMGHVEALKIEFPDYQDRIFALSEMVGKPYSIPDPYGGSVDGYRRMIADVERLISEGFSRIVALAERNAAK